MDRALGSRVTALSAAKRSLLEHALADVPTRDPDRAPRRAGGGVVPLSFGQERLWFLAQLDAGGALYNVPLGLRLRGALDVEALRAALAAVVARHEALRTGFVAQAGRPVQVVLDQVDVALPLVELDGDRAEAQRIARRLAGEPFDLARAPLLRARLLRLAAQEHLLVLCLHHIVFDGWSLGVLLRELSEHYNAHRADRPPRLPALSIQYADYAVWQRAQLDTRQLREQLAFWQTQLAGAPELLQLPTDRPRSGRRGFAGGRVSRQLPAPLATELHRLAREHHSTLFCVLLAALQAQLARLSGQHDLSIGTPVAGREHPQTEPLIGFFTNTLVLRSQLDPDPTFQQLLQQARRSTLAALDHQTLPFERLVEHLKPHRTLTHTPLFQIVLNLQPPFTPSPFTNLQVEPAYIANPTSTFDLTIVAESSPAAIRLSAQYSSDLFDQDTVARRLEGLESLLAGAVADPGQRLSRLPVMPAHERRRLLVDWNRTQRAFPRERPVHELVAEQARRRPRAPAVVTSAGERVGYGELAGRVRELAGRLRRCGVGPERRVAVLLDREVSLVVCLLAVLEAGGAFVPLDPAAPPQRLAWQLADSGAMIVLGHGERLAGLPASDARPLPVDGDPGQDDGAAAPAARARPENLAYLIYTSGSTGTPKGVLIEHAGLTNLVTAKMSDFVVGPSTRTLQFAALGFDALVSEVFVTLAAGGTLCLAEPAQLLPGPPLQQLLAEQQITMVTLPPSALALLDPGTLPALRTVLSAGEPCTPEIARRWTPGRDFFNAYGPTEATVGATLERSPGRAGPLSIGRPIANKELFVLDEHLQPVPIGIPGELYLAGSGLARGYHNQPALTARQFLPHPYSPHPGARLYRTGDRARYRPDGRLEFLGRTDHQLKVRGYRIEPGEIETVLRQHPDILDALVSAHQGQLTAYLQPKDPNNPPTPSSLRQHLRHQLPAYMHPSLYHILTEIPHTSNGKLDRTNLPAPKPAINHPHTPPTTPIQHQLATIWATTLNHAPIGIHDNFFELGGDSIRSIEVVVRANEEGLPLTPRMMFEHQTVAEQAAALAEAAGRRAEQGPVTGPAALLPSQRWFFEQGFADPHHWNQAVLLHLRRRLAPAALRETIRAILEHHDGLRARFERHDGDWMQWLAAPDDGVPLDVVDLSSVPQDAVRSTIERAGARLHTSLNLARGPLVRFLLFDAGPGVPGHLLIVAHHLVIDSLSWLVLQDDIERTYLQVERGAPVALPPKTTSVPEWAEALERSARSPDVQGRSSLWRAIAAAPVASLPVDPTGDAEDPGIAGSETLQLPAELVERLRSAARSLGPRGDEGLLAATGLAVARWTGLRSVLLEVEGHGRDALPAPADPSRTAGWLTTAYPVLLQLETIDAAGAMAAVQRADEMREHGWSYALLCHVARDPSLRDLAPEIGFNVLGGLDRRQSRELVEGWTVAGPLQSAAARRPHLLDLAAVPADGCIALDVSWSAHAWRRASIDRLLDGLQDAIADVAEHASAATAERTAADFPLAQLDDDQLQRLALVVNRDEANTHSGARSNEADP